MDPTNGSWLRKCGRGIRKWVCFWSDLEQYSFSFFSGIQNSKENPRKVTMLQIPRQVFFSNCQLRVYKLHSLASDCRVSKFCLKKFLNLWCQCVWKLFVKELNLGRGGGVEGKKERGFKKSWKNDHSVKRERLRGRESGAMGLLEKREELSETWNEKEIPSRLEDSVEYRWIWRCGVI